MRGTDLRLSEVSKSMKYLMTRGWIKRREDSFSKGRPKKIYDLAVPIAEIMDPVEKETKKEANNQLARIKKIQNYLN